MKAFHHGALAAATLLGLLQPAQAAAQTGPESMADEACLSGATGCVSPPLAVQSGQIATINPETGELVPQDEPVTEMSDETRAEIEAFNQQLLEQSERQFSVEGLEERRTEDGAVGIDLGDRFLVPYVVHIAPDGTQHFGHGAIATDH